MGESAQPRSRLDWTGRTSESDLADTLAADHLLLSVDGRRLPLALAVRVPQAAVALRRAGRAVPAVDADVGRPVAQVVA